MKLFTKILKYEISILKIGHFLCYQELDLIYTQTQNVISQISTHLLNGSTYKIVTFAYVESEPTWKYLVLSWDVVALLKSEMVHLYWSLFSEKNLGCNITELQLYGMRGKWKGQRVRIFFKTTVRDTQNAEKPFYVAKSEYFDHT